MWTFLRTSLIRLGLYNYLSQEEREKILFGSLVEEHATDDELTDVLNIDWDKKKFSVRSKDFPQCAFTVRLHTECPRKESGEIDWVKYNEGLDPLQQIWPWVVRNG